ncbi:hypothetical protein [Thiolapillus brandeum]|uniref:Uncharacterized protein n=1 Tax=Thiolapillus brandeum TaxID=1076588 RepID=A0A7U6JGV5_9GAMM|nr:hypothetical protein [Thiolapillus brandeum]BAO43899.1 hypothetical protein TBH_C0969 [Thiolapillus brandeum]
MNFSKRHYQPSSEPQRETVEKLRNISRRLGWRMKWAQHEIQEAQERINQWRQ